MRYRRQPALVFILLFIACQYLNAEALNDTKSCTSVACHNTLIDQRVIHDPVEDGCNYCHESSGKAHPANSGNEFSLTEQLPVLCESCHDTYDKKHIHAPVEEGDCLTCHSVHSSPNLMLLKSAPEQKLCEDCHDSDRWSNAHLHAPLEDGKCTKCHNPHQSDNSSLLHYELPELCFECHQQQKKEEAFETIHPPFEEDCLECHLVHSSNKKRLLKISTPNLCYECHDDFQNNILDKRSVHNPLKTKTSCMNCHSAHATHEENLLVEKRPALCFNCHGNAVSDKERKTENIEKKIQRSQIVHPPVADGECTECHNAHFADYPYLLSNAFPEYAYTTGIVDSFALCFDCHDSGLMTVPQTRDATNFRNGTQNLHYLHIHREKGLSCVDCHDVHATNRLHLVADRVRFGRWNMPINYRSTKRGGSCLTGCHKKMEYNRELSAQKK